MSSVAVFPPLAVPFLATTLYTSQKLLNNTYYKSFKDLAFIARKNKDSIKIYQDVLRPDIFKILTGLDKREKLGFLQLQTLVGMTKFDAYTNTGNPLTLQTDSHGIVRKTFQKLTELGYLQNYEETYLKETGLLLPKLAFSNFDLKTKTSMYNMRFQRTEKVIDFDDPEFKKMFPMVFAQRGILGKQGYEIQKKENGEFFINYKNRKPKEPTTKKSPSIRDTIKEPISLESQRSYVRKFLRSSNSIEPPQSKDIEK